MLHSHRGPALKRTHRHTLTPKQVLKSSEPSPLICKELLESAVSKFMMLFLLSFFFSLSPRASPTADLCLGPVSHISRCSAEDSKLLSTLPVCLLAGLPACLSVCQRSARSVCGKVRRLFHSMATELNLTVIRSYTRANGKAQRV